MRKRHRVVGVVALVTTTLVLANRVHGVRAVRRSRPPVTSGSPPTRSASGWWPTTTTRSCPGIFKGAADAVQGAAKYINANGGIAGRKLVVDVYDSKLNANEARNAFI